MVAREGNAPSSAGCRPAVLLLNYRARRNWRSTGDLHPGRLCWRDCFQDSFLDWPDVLRWKWLPLVVSHHAHTS